MGVVHKLIFFVYCMKPLKPFMEVLQEAAKAKPFLWQL
jgi:hypothetical protein